MIFHIGIEHKAGNYSYVVKGTDHSPREMATAVVVLAKFRAEAMGYPISVVS